MTAFEQYVFVLCVIVFVLLTTVFTTMIVVITRQLLRIVKNGLDDDKIWAEYQKEKGKKKKKAGVLEVLFSAVFYCAVFAVFGFSVYLNVVQDNVNGAIPVPRVVQSASMAKKYAGNKYLFDNDLNDQFDMFDIVVTRKLPDQFDLELYDIVVYEVDDTLVIHRIVAIEEPNETHPNERYFRMQGDNVHVADKFPVKYEQMKAIYVGERIPMVGSFIMFMQSPAGYLCILLILVAMIAMPRVEKKVEREKRKRIEFLLRKEEEEKLARAKAEEPVKKQIPAPCCACPIVRKAIGTGKVSFRKTNTEGK